ncbi:hypothetical protein BGZ63DRAFT_80730 [Mariannaea sp. PMI_226]|nr:hypothetical protein BGZ63DRAFT_80730 [Mariannaea sp. PMI_226]
MQAFNSCAPCRQSKRRCDRNWPRCSTCSRVGRTCVYDTDTLRPLKSDVPENALYVSSDGEASSTFPHQSQPTTGVSAIPGLIDITVGIEPFRHDSLRRPMVDVIVQKEVFKIIGSRGYMHEIANLYFDSIAKRISIISAQRFYRRLSDIASSSCAADFAALCLCVYLVLQVPPQHENSMQSSLYVTSKSIISLLEATSYHSLEVVQCRVLIAFYEIGHGIYPAAAISIGGCAKMVHFAGFYGNSILPSREDEMKLIIEEKKRTLWALHNLDRYLSLSLGESSLTTPFAQEADPLPIEESLWSENITECPVMHVLNTPSDVCIGSFARECQMFHLVGRVLRNIYEPIADEDFQAEEAKQLETTMSAFVPLLYQDGEDYGKYCISYAIYGSAIFTLYGCSTENDNKANIVVFHAKLAEETSLGITRYCRRLFGNEEEIDYGILSPVVPYTLYQAAVIQIQLHKRNPQVRYEENINFLKRVLMNFNRRWLVAGKYLLRLRENSPPLLCGV